MSTEAGSIVWLASYPSSGNTWMRILLSNLIRNENSPADINDLNVSTHAASRGRFDIHAAVRASELTDDEIQDLRPAVYESMALEAPGPWFVKIHDAYMASPSGPPIISHRATRSVVYIVRNPLDVAVSYAHQQDVSFDTCISRMEDESHYLGTGERGLKSQIRQHLGSWSTHVLSWMNAPGLRVHVVRYEDLKADPVRAFGAVADFSGLPYAREDLIRAVAFSDFPEVHRQEDEAGFASGTTHGGRFFRRGETGAWRGDLSPAQAQRIIDRHGPAMRRLGYLDDAGTVS